VRKLEQDTRMQSKDRFALDLVYRQNVSRRLEIHIRKIEYEAVQVERQAPSFQSGINKYVILGYLSAFVYVLLDLRLKMG
jgi:hypothetical protein